MSLLAAVVLAGGAVVPAPGDTDVSGLWSGTLGSAGIVACFETGNPGSPVGAYYYTRHLVPIALGMERGEAGRWREFRDTGRWQVQRDGGRLTGTWKGEGKTLPIALEQVPWQRGSDGWPDSPCVSAEFQAARAFTPEIEARPADLSGWSYEILAWQPPAHFADDAAVTFAFDAVAPGDAAIMRQVRAAIPDGRPVGDFFECVMLATTGPAADADWSVLVEPVFVDRRFLTAKSMRASFCGGAHPEHWVEIDTYDRATGERVAIEQRWFGANGFAPAGDNGRMITPALRAVVLAHAPVLDPAAGAEEAARDDECRNYLAAVDFWRVGLVAGGIAFIPSVAHAVAPCEETHVVPWAALGDFLADEGRAARDAVSG